MSATELLAAAARNLRRRPLRNALAALGVLLGSATLVALLGLANGLQANVLERMGERPLLTLVQVLPASPRAGEAPRPLDDRAVDALARLAHVRAAMPVVVVPATLRSGERTTSGTILGVSPQGKVPYALAAGRAPTPSEADAAVLTPTGLRGLGLATDSATGRALALELRRGTYGAEGKTLAFRIVGVVAEDIPGALALVPLQQAEDAIAWIATGESDAARDLRLAQQVAATLLIGGRAASVDLAGSRYSSIWILADSPASLRDVTGAIADLGYGAYSQAAAAETVAALFDSVRAGLGAIALIALAVAALGVANALLTSVSERTAEIGVLKALGATDATVERLFLAEAALLGVAGGVGGVALGWLGATLAAALAGRALGSTVTVAPRVDPPLLALSLAVATGLALLAGWLPARRAAALPPAVALRSE